MFGQLGNIAGLMKQAKEMQGRMKEMQEALASSRFTADSGGGAVTATVTGKMELVDIKINPEIVKPDDIEMLEDLIKSSIAAAQRKAADGMKEHMQKMTGGINLPGLDNLLGGAEGP